VPPASVYGQSEWQAAARGDPRGFARKLLPVRVEDCPRPGPLGAIVSIDLFDQEPEQANQHLLMHVGHALTGRAKPAVPPDFPVRRLNAPFNEPTFPADQSESPAPPVISSRRRSLVDQLANERHRFGVDNPRTLTTASALVVTLADEGEYEAARAVAEDVLERRRRELGADHADTLITASNLVAMLDRVGEYEAARTLAEDTLDRRRRVLGANHADTLATAGHLDDALNGLGE
jgi:hypothetical protein